MSHALVKVLTEKRQNIWNETKALLDAAAEGEGRDFTAEETVTYDRLSGDLTSLRSRIDSVTATMAENRAAEEALAKAIGTGAERNTEGSAIETSLRSYLKGETREFGLDAASMREPWKRALAKGAAATGGDTIPTSFHDQLIEHLVASSGVLQAGPTVLNTTSGEALEVPVTTSHGAAALVEEAGNLAGTDPAFAKRTLGAYKYGQLVLVAKELVDDTAVDLVGYIASAAGRNVGLAFGTHLVTGTGGGVQPTGIATTATAGKTGAAAVAGVFTADEMIDLFFSVIGPYRNSPSAAWIVKDSTLGAIRKLKDSASRYLFEPAATFGAPDTLLGKKIFTDPNVAAVAATTKSVVFGDISKYFVRIAGGVRFERSDEYAFGSDQIAFRAIIRGDGLLVDQTGAVKTFTGGAAA